MNKTPAVPIFVVINDAGEHGPFSHAQIKKLARTGKIKKTDIIRHGQKNYQAGNIKGLWDTREPEERVFEVFVSHATPDKEFADRVVESFESRGMKCWIAPRDIPAGAQWTASIVAGIDQCRALIVVFSGSSNNSSHVVREVERAVARGKAVVPVRIEDIGMRPEFEYLLSSIQWLDATDGSEEDCLSDLTHLTRAFLSASVIAPNTVKRKKSILARLRRLFAKLPMAILLVAAGFFARPYVLPPKAVAPATNTPDPRSVALNQLVEGILTNVDPSEWEDIGGANTLSNVDGSLTVTAPREVVQAVARYLNQIRSERQIPVKEFQWQELSPMELRIEETLLLTYEPEFIETPLDEICQYMSDEFAMPIRLDIRECEMMGLDPYTPVNITLPPTPLSVVLKEVTQPLGLAPVIANDQLLLTSVDREKIDFQRTQTFNVEDILSSLHGHVARLEQFGLGEGSVAGNPSEE